MKIHDLGSQGEGVGYHEGMTYFVEGALPGEEVEVDITLQKKSYGKGVLKNILKPSPHRVEAPCEYYDRCGGCQLMHLEYAEQLNVKRKRVVDALERVGGMKDPKVELCCPSPKEFHYRNKIQLQKGFGYFARGSNDLVEVDRCLIHNEIGEEVYRNIHPKVGGKVRYLLLKTAYHTNQVLVVLVTREKPNAELRGIAKQIIEVPHVAGVVHNYNPKEGNVVLGSEYTLLEGKSTIEEVIGDLTFSVSAASFFQVNKLQAENLYQKALDLADLEDKTVLDLYCGVGTLSLLAAKKAQSVVGIECVPEAIEDAKQNARNNQIENVSFICGRVEDTELPQIDIVLLNPPRKGVEKGVIDKILALKPKAIVYISCNPATLARDQKEMVGYQLEGAYPFDMFPQTAHVEVVAYFSQR